MQFARENANVASVVENTPPHYWWIIVAAMAAIMSVTFVKLQSKDLLVSQQLEELGELAARICSDVGVEGPYDVEDAEDTVLDEHFWFVNSRWRVKTETVFEFLYDYKGSSIQG